MICTKIKNGFVCDFTSYRNYLCFEHTTYLFEFGKFGPAWFTVPGDEMVDVDPYGNNKFLWDCFEEWMKSEEGKMARPISTIIGLTLAIINDNKTKGVKKFIPDSETRKRHL